jgi:hypothetical protein
VPVATSWSAGPTAVLGAVAASLGLARPGSPVRSLTELVAAFDPDRLPREPWRFDPTLLP